MAAFLDGVVDVAWMALVALIITMAIFGWAEAWQ